MDSPGPLRVRGDSGSRPNSPVSVEGGQASHAPSMNEQGQVVGNAVDILQQIAQSLQRAVQPVAVTPQRSSIERMGRKDDEPSMAEIGSRGPSECDRTRPRYPPRVLQVVPPSEVPLYNP